MVVYAAFRRFLLNIYETMGFTLALLGLLLFSQVSCVKSKEKTASPEEEKVKWTRLFGQF